MLRERGFRLPVGPDDAVDAEVHVGPLDGVARSVVPVAGVGEAGRAVAEALTQPVVPELPDEAALQSVVRFDRVPVLGEAAVAVAHGVRVLAHDQRQVGTFLVFGPAHDVGDLRVHRAQHVGDVLAAGPVAEDRALVVQGSGRVVAADPRREGVVSGAVAGLVAEGPHDDARMVLVALHHPSAAVHPRVHVPRIVAEAEDVRMRLDVGLVDHVHAELVAEVVEAGIVGCVCGAHRVESVLLHEHEIRPHLVDSHDASGVGVEVVPIDATQQHRRAVHEELAPANVETPESDPEDRVVAYVAVGIDEIHAQPVAARDLG